MPTGRNHQIQKIRGGDWNNVNDPVDPYRNELGQKATIDDKDYIHVKLDSGATSATPSGAQAAFQVAYFKDRSAMLVTNDARMSIPGIHRVAGIFPCTVTPGNLTALWTGRSRDASVGVDGSAFVAGDSVVSAASGTPIGTRIAAGTAVDPGSFIGVSKGVSSASVLAVDLMLPDWD